MSEPNPADYIPILVSLVSVGISIGTFIKKQKSDEFRIALDIHSRHEQGVNELIQVSSDEQKRRQKSLEHLNIWEYFAFLVNNKEIKNANIQKYFKPSLVSEAERIFKDYPDIYKDTQAYEEIKKLLRKWNVR